MLQTIDEGLRDGAKLVLASSDTLCLGIECLGATYKQVGTAKLLPTVSLAEALTCTLVEYEVDEALLGACSADSCEHSFVFCWQVVVVCNLKV